MYFLSINNPTVDPLASWVNDDYNGLNSYISVTIPTTGSYLLLVRAYGNYSSSNNYGAGVCDLWKDGSAYRVGVPVAGWSSGGGLAKFNQNVNFFTGKLSLNSDTRLFVAGGFTSQINFQNDDYDRSLSNFSWALSSRVKASWGTQPTPFVQVNAYSISSIGTCDVYMNVLNAVVPSIFPNMKVDDAIQSAPATNGPRTPDGYNCASWAGGVTNFWFWPDDDQFSPWIPANRNYLTAFDNFYGNNPARYSGAYTYTRTGADASNASLALWANPNLDISYEPYNSSRYTHVSATKPGNDNPHGYDWESKPGRGMRTFHVKDALNNLSFSGYGNIVGYYKYTGTNAARQSADSKDISMEESLERGLSSMDKVEFDSDDLIKLDRMNQKIQTNTRNEFISYFNELENSRINPELEHFSSRRMVYGNMKEYNKLKEWCLKQGKSIYPLLISKFDVNKPYMLLLASDVLSSQHMDILEIVKKDNSKNQNDERGAYIIRTSEMNCMRFLKKLISKMDGDDSKNQANSLGQNYPNEMESSTTINFEVENDMDVSLMIYDNKRELLAKNLDKYNFIFFAVCKFFHKFCK
jgi:hypothetical protein